MLRPVTTARLHTLDTRWGNIFNRCRGPAPRSLGLAHMVVMSNGKTTTITRSVTARTVGIMRIPTRDAFRLGYAADKAEDPRTNIFLWCKIVNQDAATWHQRYATWWAQANLDFWLAQHVVALMGRTAAQLLFDAANAAGAAYRSTAGVQDWIRTVMSPGQRFGKFDRVRLLEIATHLDGVRVAMQALEGTYVSAHFSEMIAPPPQEQSELYRTATARLS